MHRTLSEYCDIEHDYAGCCICSVNPRGCVIVKRDIQRLIDERMIEVTTERNEVENEVNVIVPHFNIPERVVIPYNSQKSAVTPLVIRLPGPVPYESDRAIPYKYNATMVEDGKEVPIPSLSSVVSIADVSRVTQSGRVFASEPPKKVDDVSVGKQIQNEVVVDQSGSSSGVNQKNDADEVLKLIKKSEYNIVEQLLHTPSKISVLSLLMSSEAHRESLQKILEQAYVDHDVTIN